MDYTKYSFWLETAGEALTPRPALARSAEVDVAILGGGYSGLWTAYYLLRARPELRVAVVEKEIAGFGASGRNGGWCSSKFPVTPGELLRHYGREAAKALMLAMRDTVDEVNRVCQEEGIDAHFCKGGMLGLARGPHQLPSIRDTVAAYEALGLKDHAQFLSAEETAERIKVTKVCGALSTPYNASVHPGRLVRGLAHAVEKRGGVIYEQTEATEFAGGATPRVITPGGELRAKLALVLAGEAYLTRLRKLHRALLPMYSLIAITEPLTAAQWAQVGWQNRESVSSNRYTVDYLTRTADGRILFGSRGAPYLLGSKITDAQDRHAPTHERIQQLVVEWFPMLEGIKFTHFWGGPVGVPRDWMPSASFNRDSKIATARGYTGQGVSTTNLAGRVLADLILEKKSPLVSLPIAQRKSPNWEPEPLRWIAVRYAQKALTRIDEAQEAGRAKPIDSPIAEFLNKH